MKAGFIVPIGKEEGLFIREPVLLYSLFVRMFTRIKNDHRQQVHIRTQTVSEAMQCIKKVGFIEAGNHNNHLCIQRRRKYNLSVLRPLSFDIGFPMLHGIAFTG
jgi:hypothetical protein